MKIPESSIYQQINKDFTYNWVDYSKKSVNPNSANIDCTFIIDV